MRIKKEGGPHCGPPVGYARIIPRWFVFYLLFEIMKVLPFTTVRSSIFATLQNEFALSCAIPVPPVTIWTALPVVRGQSPQVCSIAIRFILVPAVATNVPLLLKSRTLVIDLTSPVLKTCCILLFHGQNIPRNNQKKVISYGRCFK